MPHYDFEPDFQIILNLLADAGISFQDKVVFVTGAAGFLGRGYAKVFARVVQMYMVLMTLART